MCEPVTITALVAGGIVAGGKIYQGYQEGKAATKAGDEAFRTSEVNAGIAEGAAVDATNRGDQQANALSYRTKALEGQQLAAAGASGADVQSSSFMDLISGSASMGELDKSTLRNNAAREAWGFRQQGAEITRQGVNAQRNGVDASNAAMVAAGISAAGTMASAAAGPAGTAMGSGGSGAGGYSTDPVSGNRKRITLGR